MNEVFGSIWWLIVSLGILVTFHEFGHFWVARRLGVRVLRFSVGFGRPLWRRTAKSGTEYQVAMIPLGGYVKFLDENEGDVPPELAHQAFNRQSVWRRFAIVFAGPFFNLILCLALLWGMFVLGKQALSPVVGQVSGIAAAAGFQPDEQLLDIDGIQTPTWTDAAIALTTAALDRRKVAVTTRSASGSEARHELDMAELKDDIDETSALREIGLVPRQMLLPPTVGGLTADGPAAAAGLREGDVIERIGSEDVRWYNELTPVIQRQASAGQPLDIRVRRGGATLSVSLSPARISDDDGRQRWVIGITPARASIEYDALFRYGPMDAVPAAFSETWRLTHSTLGMLGRMLIGRASIQNLSGPISIAQYANASAQQGPSWFLYFLAVLSLSLCIMNLLPIPILDGGHLLYYLIEIIKGSPVSERVLIAGQYVGLALLAGLMGLAFYVDLAR
ncbi:MAG: RIP metalloprotease RseP [Xanthomonadales bacterium]|nr:RIP metalloprotease RseP [Xanthomonadales bacterium]